VGVAWGMAVWSRRLLARGVGMAVMLAPPAALADPTLHRRPSLSAVVFGSLDVGSGKTYAAYGLKYALGGGGLDASGFRLTLKTGASAEPAYRRPTEGRLYRQEVSALIGYEWRIHDNFVAVSLGQELETGYRETRYWRSFGQRAGPRLQLDLWARPDAASLIQLNAYAVAAGSGRSGARLAAGWKLAPRLYLGPEVEAYRERSFYKLRLGLHLTGIRLFGVTWRLSAGAQKTRIDKSAVYATLGFHLAN
jgi:hypothetical protein